MADHPDFLRSPSRVFDPDIRSTGVDVLGEGGFRPKTLQDQYDSVAQFTLHEGVPWEIVVKFETAKNLNLFSWFIYRFHSATRSHVYECLELALRTRFKEELYVQEERKHRTRHEQGVKTDPRGIKEYQPIDRESYRPTLYPLLQFAIEIGVLKNENFSAWRIKTEVRARARIDVEAIKKMSELGLTELEIDDSEPEITDEDRGHDYLGVVLKSIPFLRNHYAHGTGALDNHSLAAIRIASEIINQIFPEKAVSI